LVGKEKSDQRTPATIDKKREERKNSIALESKFFSFCFESPKYMAIITPIVKSGRPTPNSETKAASVRTALLWGKSSAIKGYPNKAELQNTETNKKEPICFCSSFNTLAIPKAISNTVISIPNILKKVKYCAIA